jgi:hypothetical protein
MTDTCTWTQDSCSCYKAECNGKSFVFNEDSALDNGFRFCPFCGKVLLDDKYIEEDEE